MRLFLFLLIILFSTSLYGIERPGEETEVDMYGDVWHPVVRKGE